MDIAALILSVISLVMSNVCLVICLKRRHIIRKEADGFEPDHGPGKAQTFNLRDFEEEDEV